MTAHGFPEPKPGTLGVNSTDWLNGQGPRGCAQVAWEGVSQDALHRGRVTVEERLHRNRRSTAYDISNRYGKLS